jgi:hypothetical protein
MSSYPAWWVIVACILVIMTAIAFQYVWWCRGRAFLAEPYNDACPAQEKPQKRLVDPVSPTSPVVLYDSCDTVTANRVYLSATGFYDLQAFTRSTDPTRKLNAIQALEVPKGYHVIAFKHPQTRVENQFCDEAMMISTFTMSSRDGPRKVCLNDYPKIFGKDGAQSLGIYRDTDVVTNTNKVTCNLCPDINA